MATISEDIKKMQDELNALKSQQVVSGSSVPMKVTKQQIVINLGTDRNFNKRIVFTPNTQGIHLVKIYATLPEDLDIGMNVSMQGVQENNGDIPFLLSFWISDVVGKLGTDQTFTFVAIGDDTGTFTVS